MLCMGVTRLVSLRPACSSSASPPTAFSALVYESNVSFLARSVLVSSFQFTDSDRPIAFRALSAYRLLRSRGLLRYQLLGHPPRHREHEA